jgi:hypothetical protein
LEREASPKGQQFVDLINAGISHSFDSAVGQQ